MITLTLFKKNPEEEPIVLILPEEDWSFSIRVGTVGHNDNLMVINNINKHLNDSPEVINFFNILKNTDRATIEKVILKVNNAEQFDSSLVHFYYYNVFLQYIYTVAPSILDKGNYGLSIFLGFSFIDPKTEETENITLKDDEVIKEEEV